MKARFLISTLNEFPILKSAKGEIFPEVVLAGRSNVGKSSLINHLFGQGLAKTSSTPGKTQLINFFCIEDKYLIVDLPGYGFAKAPKEEIEKWSKAIDLYIQRPNIKAVLLLIDCRRNISVEDRVLIDWASENKIPLLMIFTKTDKLSSPEKIEISKKFPGAILYTVKNSSSRHLVKKWISETLWD